MSAVSAKSCSDQIAFESVGTQLLIEIDELFCGQRARFSPQQNTRNMGFLRRDVLSVFRHAPAGKLQIFRRISHSLL
ncbi:hypothetical protein [Rhizobium yanglingense]